MRMTASMHGVPLFAKVAALLRDKRGVSAVEFALIAPLFLIIIAGIVDVSRMISTRAGLDATVSAGANYVLLNGGALDASSVEEVAAAAAHIAIGDASSGSAKVTVNDSFSVFLDEGRKSVSGKTSNADKCFCPSSTGGTVSWQSPLQCGSPCATGGIAGKFVEIRASKPYSPMFVGYRLTNGADAIEVTTMVNP